MNRTTTSAFLLQKTEHRDSDLIVTFYTEDLGVVSAIAYSARRSKRRFSTLEPFHTLRLELDAAKRELHVLQGATIAVARPHYLADLDRIQHGCAVLRWVRISCPPHECDPAVWSLLEGAMDCLQTTDEVEAEAAAFGVRLLTLLGLGLPHTLRRSDLTPAIAIRIIDEALKGQA